MNTTPDNPLLIKTYTWEKDSNELIDYESKSLHSTSFSIKASNSLYRYDNKVILSKTSTTLMSPFYCYLSSISVNEGNFYYEGIQKDVYTSPFNDLVNLSWLVFKGKKYPDKNQKYLLTEGEILKIGRVWLYIKEIHLNKSQKGENDVSSLNEENDVSDIKHKHSRMNIMNKISKIKVLSNKTTIKTNPTLKHKKNHTCRICYIEEEDPINNPLIRPCSCSGSMRYIHLLCLRQWLSSKVLVKATTFSPVDFCTTYTLTHIECELCKERFPDSLIHDNKQYNLIDINDQGISSDDESYIVFDTISPDRNNNKFRYYVKFDGKYLRIGRGLEVQLMLGDISVSRIHCILSIIGDKKVVIEDFNSKFGTLILLRNPHLQIANEMGLTVQIGRSYLNMEVKQPFRMFSCCNANDRYNDLHYEIENKRFVKEDEGIYIKEEPEDSGDSEDEDVVKQNVKKGTIRIIKENGNDGENENENKNVKNGRYGEDDGEEDERGVNIGEATTGREGVIILNNNHNPLKETKLKDSGSLLVNHNN